MAVTNRVLVVDDHDAWRRQICSLLREAYPQQTVDEAADGQTAIEKAETLEPDFVLLDVTLPVVNGFEVASQILAGNPHPRILFVSLHRSFEIVEAALATGAQGYVVKSDSSSLLPALETLAAGRPYLSPTLTGRNEGGQRCHEMGFYDDEARLTEYGRFGSSALRSQKSLIFVSDAPRRQQFRRVLEACAVDVRRALNAGRYIELDVTEMLAAFLVGDRIDEARFWRDATALFLRAARASGGGVAACGDASATVLRRGRTDAALRLEQLWDQWARSYNADVFCGYPRHTIGDDPYRSTLEQICAAHSAVRL
jgi:DNA-binding NarL/FixJ family response regulator